MFICSPSRPPHHVFEKKESRTRFFWKLCKKSQIRIRIRIRYKIKLARMTMMITIIIHVSRRLKPCRDVFRTSAIKCNVRRVLKALSAMYRRGHQRHPPLWSWALRHYALFIGVDTKSIIHSLYAWTLRHYACFICVDIEALFIGVGSPADGLERRRLLARHTRRFAIFRIGTYACVAMNTDTDVR